MYNDNFKTRHIYDNDKKMTICGICIKTGVWICAWWIKMRRWAKWADLRDVKKGVIKTLWCDNKEFCAGEKK